MAIEALGEGLGEGGVMLGVGDEAEVGPAGLGGEQLDDRCDLAAQYAATKGALVAIARGWAAALAHRSIRVNVLVPGPIGTRFRDFMTEDTREAFEADVIGRLPLGRVGTADQAAAVALFLLSDDSTYVTASQYAVDGGLTMR